MIDFATLQGLTIPEGVVTQITDASGRVLWALQSNKPVVLEVAKQTLTTYAGETSYANESFVLLDIYPKTNGTVKVTYGGLTKIVTDTSGAAEPNAQQVFFGTFNGVSDSVTTPESGELTIEGGCRGFGCGVYQNGSKTSNTDYCSCITAVTEWGSGITYIPDRAFYNCASLALAEMPNGIINIGNYAFYNCTNLAITSLPNSVAVIGGYAFYNCTNLAITSLPSGLKSIPYCGFYKCENIIISEVPEGVTSIEHNAFYGATSMRGGKITLPSTLQSIYLSALSETSFTASADYDLALGNITVFATTPPTVEDADAIIDRSTAFEKIIVPKGCADAYKLADGWKQFDGYIVEAS